MRARRKSTCFSPGQRAGKEEKGKSPLPTRRKENNKGGFQPVFLTLVSRFFSFLPSFISFYHVITVSCQTKERKEKSKQSRTMKIGGEKANIFFFAKKAKKILVFPSFSRVAIKYVSPLLLFFLLSTAINSLFLSRRKFSLKCGEGERQVSNNCLLRASSDVRRGRKDF